MKRILMNVAVAAAMICGISFSAVAQERIPEYLQAEKFTQEKLNTIPGMVPPPGAFPAGGRFCDRCELFNTLLPDQQTRCRTIPPESMKISPDHWVCCNALTGEKK